MHLHQRNIVHRDVACRNLLVDGDNNVHVADFGCARLKQELYGKDYTQSGLRPIRWEAPECLSKGYRGCCQL